MLLPYLSSLSGEALILASGSPRRCEILSRAGLTFCVSPSQFEETLDKSTFPSAAAYAMENSKQKALEVYYRLVESGEQEADLIIGSDTVVSHNDRILEKPRSEESAVEMLKSLSANKHTVYSGVTILRCKANEKGERTPYTVSFYEGTDVVFAELSDDLVNAYVATGEPMDKAGAYGIQGMGGSFVESINGCYYNVMGFPYHRFCKYLAAILESEAAGTDYAPSEDDEIAVVASVESGGGADAPAGPAE